MEVLTFASFGSSQRKKKSALFGFRFWANKNGMKNK
jgi:hypothetical protein